MSCGQIGDTQSRRQFYYSFAYTQSDLLEVCYHVPATRQNSTNGKSFKSALFVGAGRENMTPGQTVSSCRKNVTPRIQRAGLNQAEQAVCPCGVTVLGVFRARIGCSHSERALGETPLIYKVQTSQGKGIMKQQPHARERRVYRIALVRSPPPPAVAPMPVFSAPCSQNVPECAHSMSPAVESDCSLFLQRNVGSFSHAASTPTVLSGPLSESVLTKPLLPRPFARTGTPW